MDRELSIVALPGDGIGNEIFDEARKVLNWINNNSYYKLNITEELVGGSSIDEFGEPLTNNVLDKLRVSDAILLGAVGGPQWEGLTFDKRPERGLLKIRKELDLFANFRPAIVFDSLASSSSLKSEIINGLDLMIIRELTGGIYFGEPRGVEKLNENNYKGFNTLVYTSEEVRRIASVAFETARSRSKKLCSVDKANVLESTELWRKVVIEVSKDYSDVELTHMYVDNASMQLVRDPKQFDVIVTTNMFGDILSDCASMLTGSLGMLPSASVGVNDLGGKNAMYGSAPDISGKSIANPLAMILSVAMMFKYSFEDNSMSDLVIRSVNKVLNNGYRTKDIFTDECKLLSTSDMGDAVIKELKNEEL